MTVSNDPTTGPGSSSIRDQRSTPPGVLPRSLQMWLMIGLAVLILAIILGGLGFAIHILWWIALVVLVVWVFGFLLRVGEGGSRSRWYRW